MLRFEISYGIRDLHLGCRALQGLGLYVSKALDADPAERDSPDDTAEHKNTVRGRGSFCWNIRSQCGRVGYFLLSQTGSEHFLFGESRHNHSNCTRYRYILYTMWNLKGRRFLLKILHLYSYQNGYRSIKVNTQFLFRCYWMIASTGEIFKPLNVSANLEGYCKGGNGYMIPYCPKDILYITGRKNKK